MSRATTHDRVPFFEALRRLFLAFLSFGRSLRRRVLAQQVVGDEVAQRQRGHLHDVDFDVDVLEVLQVAIDHVPLHGEQADLGLHGEAVGHRAGADLLEIPDHLVQRERNLLLGLEADDVGDLLLFDGRQLDEASQAALTGNADRNVVPAAWILRDRNFSSASRVS